MKRKALNIVFILIAPTIFVFSSPVTMGNEIFLFYSFIILTSIVAAATALYKDSDEVRKMAVSYLIGVLIFFILDLYLIFLTYEDIIVRNINF